MLSNIMQSSLLLASLAWFAAGADNAHNTLTQYLLSADTTVHAESGVGTYDRTIRTELHASVLISGSDATLRVHRDNYTCILHGAIAGKSLALTQGQKCPQSIRGDGFQAELDGTLQSGAVMLGTNSLMLTTKWEVRGTVKVGPLSIPVTGNVSTTATGQKL